MHTAAVVEASARPCAAFAPLAEPRLRRAFRGHRGGVTALAFHPDEQQVVSSSLDGCVFVWHSRVQLRPYRFVGHKGEVHDIAVSSTGQRIASASSDRTVRLWSNSPQGDSQPLKAHTATVRSVCFSRDDSLLLTASDDKTVKLWCMLSQRFRGSLTGHTNWVYSAALCKDSALAVSGGEDKVVRVWDVERKAVIMTFEDFEVAVSKVAFHPDGSCVAACGHDGCVKLWDLRSRKLVQHYDAHAGPARSLSFRCGGEHLLTAGEDEALKFWDLREGRLLYKVLGHKQPASACAFAPSGRSFASGGRDNLVFIWDCFADAGGSNQASTGLSAVAPVDVGGGSGGSPWLHRRSVGGPRIRVADSAARPASAGPLRGGLPKRATRTATNTVPAATAHFERSAGPRHIGWVSEGAAEGELGSPALRELGAAILGSFADLDAAFAAFDVNGSGQLSAAEFQAGAEAVRFRGDSYAVFHELDAGRCGVIDRRAFAALARLSDNGTGPSSQDPLMEAWSPEACKPPQTAAAQPLATDAGFPAGLPEPLVVTLHSMRGHLELMARTVQLLERRLAVTEAQVVEMRKEMLRGAPSHPT